MTSSKLALIDTFGIQASYITLSHVWGKAQIIMTTTSTLAERIEGIAMESLSNTFRDAVEVARQMNVRYLWIDSLCIIQNDLVDWEKESAKMGSYYSNALFNIAAVSSGNGSGGLFTSHNPHEMTPCPITVVFPSKDSIRDGKKIEGFLRANSGWDPALQVAGFQRPPLWQRAWVLQERLLSNRLLMFSSMQMSWKCRQEEASESVPEGSQRHADMTSTDEILQLVLMGLKKLPLMAQVVVQEIVDSEWEGEEENAAHEYGTEESIQVYNAWYDLVSLYTKCELTIASDIFPAISGIASDIASATQDRYVAGLWTRDIHRGLLWSAPDSTISKPDLRQYRAPSWSWASLGATSNFHVREMSQKGLKVSTKLFTFNGVAPHAPDVFPFGKARVDALKVTGILKRAHPVDTNGGLPEEAVFKDIPHGRETLFDLNERKSVGWYFADNIDRKHLNEVWCCPIMTEERPPRQGEKLRDGQTSVVEARGVALLLLDQTEKIGMRVGSLWIRDASWFDGCETESFSII
jgi:heterokaryon incompatibility protein (HET)